MANETISSIGKTYRLRQAVFNGYAEAQRTDDDHVSAEHILIPLARTNTNPVHLLLSQLSIDPVLILKELERNRASSYGRSFIDIPLTGGARRVLKLSVDEAENLGHNDIGPEHFLLGILLDGQVLSAKIILKQGINIDAVRALVVEQHHTFQCEISTMKASPRLPCLAGIRKETYERQ